MNAKLIPQIVEEVVVRKMEVRQEEKIVLELTREEAECLCHMCGYTACYGRGGEITKSVYKELGGVLKSNTFNFGIQKFSGTWAWN